MGKAPVGACLLRCGWESRLYSCAALGAPGHQAMADGRVHTRTRTHVRTRKHTQSHTITHTHCTHGHTYSSTCAHAPCTHTPHTRTHAHTPHTHARGVVRRWSLAGRDDVVAVAAKPGVGGPRMQHPPLAPALRHQRGLGLPVEGRIAEEEGVRLRVGLGCVRVHVGVGMGKGRGKNTDVGQCTNCRTRLWGALHNTATRTTRYTTHDASPRQTKATATCKLERCGLETRLGQRRVARAQTVPS